MPIDFSPISNIRPINLAEIYGAADQQNAQRQALQYQQMQMARQQKLDQQEDATRGAYSINPQGQLDEKATLENLYRVNPQKALELQQTLTNQKSAQTKAEREARDSQLSQAEKVGNLMKQSSTFIMANPSLQNAVNETQRFGQLTGADVTGELQTLQQIGDNPEAIKRWAAGHALSAEQLITKPMNQDLGGTVRTSNYDPISGKQTVIGEIQKTATPGEINSNKIAQARLQEEKRHNGVSEINGAGGKAPSGYRWSADGQLEAIPGGPGDKSLNPTEAQGKAALFSSRALEADKILNGLNGKYSPAGINAKMGAEDVPIIGGLIGPAANMALSSESQQAEQAQRDFVNAILRQESGAAIGKSEFTNARKQYFPQPGDSAEVIAQKAANRQTAIRGLATMAGPTGKNIADGNILPKNSTIAPKKGTIEQGYVYIGGDPAKPESWKKAK